MPIEPGSLDRFKNITSKDWWAIYGRQGAWYKTIDHEKYAQALHGMVTFYHATDWMLGRFVVELQKQIQVEFEKWYKEYYKDPEKKPEYTSAESWFNDHRSEAGISWRQAKRHRYVFLNAEFEFADLGYKKIKMIDDFIGDDKETKRKISQLIKQKKWNESEVERSLELFVNNIEEEARAKNLKPKVFKEQATERVLKKIENIIDHKMKEEIEIKDIISKGKDAIIRCTRVSDAERVRDVLVQMEPTIKLKAFRYK